MEEGGGGSWDFEWRERKRAMRIKLPPRAVGRAVGRAGGGRKAALLDRRMGAKKDGASRSLTTVIDWTARRRAAAAATVPGRCAVVRINVNLPPPRARDNDKRTMTKNRRRR